MSNQVLEKRAKLAALLYKTANQIGVAINEVEANAIELYNVYLENNDDYESVVLKGEEVMVAMRKLAVALDRAVVVKSMNDD